MRRIALGCLLLTVTGAPAARAADRTDPIPASVGPADFRGYHVNAEAHLPEGLSAERWNDIARRAVERWGGTYLGTTSASPDDQTDGRNVVGFSPAVSGAALGINAKAKEGQIQSLGDVCEPAPAHQPDERVVDVRKRFRLRLRADVVRRGRVRRRTRTVTKTLAAKEIQTARLDARRCRRLDAAETDPQSVRHESDVQMRVDANWYFGSEHPDPSQVDLETVLLHELGHSVGLAHQPQDCDPSTPMRPVTSSGEFWRGVDEVLYAEPCEAPYQPAADPPTGGEGPIAVGATLGGRAFHVNPAVPRGYDGDRFLAVARSAVERWGGSFAGTTDRLPVVGDGLNVIGFDLVAAEDYELTVATIEERYLLPLSRTCTTRTGRPAVWRTRRATRRVRAGGRTFRLRRDRAVRARGPATAIPTGTCATTPPRVETTATSTEVDVGIAHEMVAWEMGPRHPVQRTRMDMTTMLLVALGQAAAAPSSGDSCDLSTPLSAPLIPGDWWRSPTDVRREGCAQPRAAQRSAPTDSGRVRIVRVQD